MLKSKIKNYHQFIVKVRSHYPDIPMVKRRLARARINKIRRYMLTPEQVQECENDAALRRKTVAYYSKKWEKRLKKELKKAKDLCRNVPGDAKENYVDMLFCRLAYGFAAEEYITFQLKDKTPEERKTYVSDQQRFCNVYRMNDISELQIFNDKARTYEKLAPYYKRDAVSLQKKEDLPAFMAFVEKHPVFVKKNAMESVGRGVELIDIAQLEVSPEDYFLSLIKEGKHILEEKIEQDESLAQFNPSSLNTVRCIAFKTRHGVETPYCFIRFGRNGSFVDNAGAGGVFAGIDEKTGVIDSDAYDRNYDLYTEHPDTHVPFKGFQLPEWEEMLRIVREMSGQLEKIRYVGWDMAYSTKGWAVVEGNGMSQMIASQFIYKKGIKEEVDGYMADMDLILP